MDKVAIMLTDGVNQCYDWPTGLPNNPDADYTRPMVGSARDAWAPPASARQRLKSTTG
tara:strand:+ start:1740 stop:1913 length:174 start_codon:yes stop_codon:yes gene_type:complete